MIDACQLLGLDRSFKYDQGNMESLAAIANACHQPGRGAPSVYFHGWCSVLLAGNGDAHLKNLSFMVSQEGVQLAPFYDLLQRCRL